jgi:hypothetical protein
VILAGEDEFCTTRPGVVEGEALLLLLLLLGAGCGGAGATLRVGAGDAGGLEGLDEKCELWE